MPRKQNISVAISPSSVSLSTGATQQFAATVSGTTATGVIWSVNSVVGGNATVGTVSTAGLYTAPATVPSGSVTVQATSVANTSKKAAASVTITQPAPAPAAITIAVSPTSASLQTGATKQFTSTVSGTTNTGVNWTVNGVAGGNSTVGTISSSGLYTAPATVPSGSVSVAAQSQADTTKSASAAISLSAPAPTSTYAISVSAQSNHSGAVALNGATLSGSDYVFTSLASNLGNYDPSGITQVCFWLDNIAMSGTATHCEGVMPYDFIGSADNTTTSLALAWNTATLANGTHSITQKVTLSSGATEVDSATFQIKNVVAPPTVATTTLPGATQNAAYSSTLAGSGGTTPYSWSLAGGALPSGVSLASNGTISGTPTVTGSFAVTVKLTDASGQTASASETLSVAAAGSTPPSSGAKFFGASSFINSPLPSSPSIDPNSASMVQNSLVAQASAAHLSNGDYGVGLVYASASDKVYSVACTTYDSATCMVGSHINFPIPKGAVPPAGTDHNTAFIYTANDGSPYAGMELDCWIAQYNSTNDTWSCGTASLVKNNTTAWGTCAEANITSFHCNGGYAAGFDFAAGPIRPEEIAAGTIPHALVIAVSNTGSGITCPATHTDHSGNGIPEGGHFFLPASYNVDAQSWPAWVKMVAKALQTYGGYIVDYGGSFEVKGFTDKNPGSITWSSVGVPNDQGGDLNMIPWSQMQVVTMQSCN